MARFLEIDNLGTAGGSLGAGFFLINIDKITAIHPDTNTQVWITYANSSAVNVGVTQYIQMDFDPAAAYSNLNDSMTAWIVNAIESTSNSINTVIPLANFLPEGVTITGIQIAT